MHTFDLPDLAEQRYNIKGYTVQFDSIHLIFVRKI